MSALPWRSPEAALARPPSGPHPVGRPGMGAPTSLLHALKAACVGRGWELSTGVQVDDYPFLAAVDAGELTYRTWHVSGPLGEYVADGRVGFVPARASAVPRLLEQ